MMESPSFLHRIRNSLLVLVVATVCLSTQERLEVAVPMEKLSSAKSDDIAGGKGQLTKGCQVNGIKTSFRNLNQESMEKSKNKRSVLSGRNEIPPAEPSVDATDVDGIRNLDKKFYGRWLNSNYLYNLKQKAGKDKRFYGPWRIFKYLANGNQDNAKEKKFYGRWINSNNEYRRNQDKTKDKKSIGFWKNANYKYSRKLNSDTEITADGLSKKSNHDTFEKEKERNEKRFYGRWKSSNYNWMMLNQHREDTKLKRCILKQPMYFGYLLRNRFQQPTDKRSYSRWSDTYSETREPDGENEIAGEELSPFPVHVDINK